MWRCRRGGPRRRCSGGSTPETIARCKAPSPGWSPPGASAMRTSWRSASAGGWRPRGRAPTPSPTAGGAWGAWRSGWREPGEAERDYAHAIELAPFNTKYLIDAGMLALQQHRADTAGAMFARAGAIDAADADPVAGMGSGRTLRSRWRSRHGAAFRRPRSELEPARTARPALAAASAGSRNAVKRVFAALAAILTACTPTARSSKPHGGADLLVVAQQREPASLNPALENGTSSTQWGLLLFQYLVKYDDRGNLIPDAATEIPTLSNGGISRDGMTITYHLRPGLKFADGTPLTANDCAWSIGRHQQPG